MSDIQLRKARMADVQGIHALVMEGTAQGLLLPRSLNQIYTKLRDFWVLDHGEGTPVIGCCALAIAWDNMAEVRSLLVAGNARRRGYGSLLVEACLGEARDFGINRVFSLTYQVAFFASLGFKEIPKENLPQKIWTDCIDCPKFPNCDEVAMIREPV